MFVDLQSCGGDVDTDMGSVPGAACSSNQPSAEDSQCAGDIQGPGGQRTGSPDYDRYQYNEYYS